MVNESVNI